MFGSHCTISVGKKHTFINVSANFCFLLEGVHDLEQGLKWAGTSTKTCSLPTPIVQLEPSRSLDSEKHLVVTDTVQSKSKESNVPFFPSHIQYIQYSSLMKQASLNCAALITTVHVCFTLPLDHYMLCIPDPKRIYFYNCGSTWKILEEMVFVLVCLSENYFTKSFEKESFPDEHEVMIYSKYHKSGNFWCSNIFGWHAVIQKLKANIFQHWIYKKMR